MPDHIRFLLRHAGIGGIWAILAATVIMETDMAGLATLIARSEVGTLALALLLFFLWITLGSAQMGIAIMYQDDD